MILAGSHTALGEGMDMLCCHDQRNSIPTTQLHSRRAIITTLASATLLPAGHLVAATNASPDDERFMRIALDEARQADFPFGAVIVRDGQVLARGGHRLPPGTSVRARLRSWLVRGAGRFADCPPC